MPYRAVFFDAGETLVHPSPSFPELFASTLSRNGHPRSVDQVTEHIDVISHAFVRAARNGDLWTTDPGRSRAFWLGVYEEFLLELEITPTDGLRDVIYGEFTDPGNYAAFDDVGPTIRALRDGGLRLGVISNFEPWLEDLLASLGLADDLPVRAISGIEGVEKPDTRLFEIALSKMGVVPEEAVHVGDAPSFDIEPASSLGMTAVLIDRRGRHPDHDGIVISDLRKLPEVMESNA